MESHRRLEPLPYHRALIRIAISNGPFSIPNQSWLVEVVQVQRIEKLDSMPLGPRTTTLLFTNLFASECYELALLWFKGCKALHVLGSLVLLSHRMPYRKFWNGDFVTANLKCLFQNIKYITPFLSPYPVPQPWPSTHPWSMSLSVSYSIPEH